MALSAIPNTAEKNKKELTALSKCEITIDKAKEQLIRIITTYLEKKPDNSYAVPFNKQRPVMLMGPAGIGKTDIPRQAAKELGIGFVSYSITHHTRQSALGLPKIIEKDYSGSHKIATEYTMSEIIASVYDEIEKTGNPSGILFLDEINCTPESLSAVLLQLFQNKTLGQTRIPEGWILVMAGNPPEYNKSVKQFDAVTLDRLRVINVIPDAKAWLNYADSQGLNSIVVSYIRSDETKIYSFDSSNSQITTPRGWEELSINIDAFENNNYPVEPELISEFIGTPDIAAEFYDYYKMIKEAVTEEDIEDIILGNSIEKIAKQVSGCSTNIKFMLITNLKRKLHKLAETKDYTSGSFAMDNIIDFITKAYGSSNEMELFMSNILSDPDIVLMAIASQNESFGKYLDEINEAESALKKQVKKRKRKEVN